MTSAAQIDAMPRDGKPEIALIGRSNVGKSSLINALLGRRSLARTSAAPGKTRTINFYIVNDSFYLVDLPGLGYAKASKKERRSWEKLIAGYVSGRPQLEVVVHLIDARHRLGEIDRDVTDFVLDAGIDYVVALTKSDKLNQKERTNGRKRIAESLAGLGIEPPIVETSATRKTGIDELWKWIGILSEQRGK